MSGFVCAERWEEITASVWKLEKQVGLFKGSCIITTVECLRGQSPPKYSPLPLCSGGMGSAPNCLVILNPPTEVGENEYPPPPRRLLSFAGSSHHTNAPAL